MNTDTIFALSSGFGKSGVAVIRISGENLKPTFEKIINKSDFSARQAYFTNLRDGNNELIDQCIAIYFASPQSFTGQDVIEIHSHGSTAVINKIFEYLTFFGFRMASRGEFSKRAFLNGKMTLSDVDGLAALLDSQTDKQRKYALKSMMGGDSKIYENWRNQMIEISAYSAAILDYSPDDLPLNIDKKILSKTNNLYQEIENALSKYQSIKAIKNGFNLVLVGETNVGKSSIFNKLVGTNRAIVSNTPGTTRDVISTPIDIDGYLVNLSDTAGVRETSDKIEQMGIDKTKTEIDNANLILHITNSEFDIPYTKNPEIMVINKSDLIQEKQNKNAIYVSAKTGDGIQDLIKIIKQEIHKLLDNTESDLIINARTYALLSESKNELKQAIEKSNGNYDIFSEHVRHASENIGKILGTITASDVMDATFSQLCLGK
ncbi:MAG: tRNA uridine-5-carboxymethylaminomethyl(34) synthesis GTPase MnmE [Alphaproteobacteria bacterium]